MAFRGSAALGQGVLDDANFGPNLPPTAYHIHAFTVRLEKTRRSTFVSLLIRIFFAFLCKLPRVAVPAVGRLAAWAPGAIEATKVESPREGMQD